MKVYSCPEEIAFGEPDYQNYDSAKELAREEAHMAKVKEWLKRHGCTGKYTGEILSLPFADGYAQYMVGDGNPSFLLHLPYGDAWHNKDAEFLPKKEVIRRIDAEKKFNELWAKGKKSA